MISVYLLAVLLHVFSTISWLGAMYFNLTLLFPMYKSLPGDRHSEMIQEQGRRAAPLLYILIFLTMISGVWLARLSGIPLSSTWAIGMMGCWLLMLTCHLYGSLSLYPRIMVALPEETPGLLLTYKVSMFISASSGTTAIVLSYLWKQPHL